LPIAGQSRLAESRNSSNWPCSVAVNGVGHGKIGILTRSEHKVISEDATEGRNDTAATLVMLLDRHPHSLYDAAVIADDIIDAARKLAAELDGNAHHAR